VIRRKWTMDLTLAGHLTGLCTSLCETPTHDNISTWRCNWGLQTLKLSQHINKQQFEMLLANVTHQSRLEYTFQALRVSA
jgi:hypothetical protein